MYWLHMEAISNLHVMYIIAVLKEYFKNCLVYNYLTIDQIIYHNYVFLTNSV